MNPARCSFVNMIARLLASTIVVAIFMVQSAHMVHATTSVVNTPTDLSEAAPQTGIGEREFIHTHAHMPIDGDKPSGLPKRMAGDCMTLSCCFVVDDRTRSVSPLFVFGLSKYLNLNSPPSRASAVMVHERPPRTV